jgi:hypothetical protein
MRGLLSLRLHGASITLCNKNTSHAVLLCGENTKRNISTEEIDSQSYSKKGQGRSLSSSRDQRTNPGCIVPRAARISALRLLWSLRSMQPFPGLGRARCQTKQS